MMEMIKDRNIYAMKGAKRNKRLAIETDWKKRKLK